MTTTTENIRGKVQNLTIKDENRPGGQGSNGKGHLRRVIITIVAVAVVAVALWGLPAVRALFDHTIDVKVVQAELTDGPMSRPVLVATGKIVADRLVRVSTKVSGQVDAMYVEQGDLVTEGQELAKIEDEHYAYTRDEAEARLARVRSNLLSTRADLASARANVLSAEASEASARADMTFAEAEFTRQKTLPDEATVEIEQVEAKARYEAAQAAVNGARAAVGMAKAAVDRAEANVAAGEAAVEESQAVLKQAQKRFDDTVVRAPIGGVILEKNAEIGDFVAAEGGIGGAANAQVVSVAEIDRLRVEVNISQLDIHRIRDDMPTIIIPEAYSDRRYTGYVMWIDPMADYSKATVQAKVRIKEPDEKLRIHGTARVEFFDRLPTTTNAAERGFWVPRSAIIDDDYADPHVYIVTGSQVRSVPVTLNGTIDGYVCILDSLSEDDRVVIDIPEQLRDGSTVRPIPYERP